MKKSTFGAVKIKSDPANERFLKNHVEYAAHELAYKIDAYVALHIQPKPRFLPDFIWKFLLKRLLVLYQFNKK